MFSLPRRWLSTAVSTSLLGSLACAAEPAGPVGPAATRPEPPAAGPTGRLPEATPSPGGEAGDAGGEVGVEGGELPTPPALPPAVAEEPGPPEDYGQIKPPVPPPGAAPPPGKVEVVALPLSTGPIMLITRIPRSPTATPITPPIAP